MKSMFISGNYTWKLDFQDSFSNPKNPKNPISEEECGEANPKNPISEEECRACASSTDNLGRASCKKIIFLEASNSLKEGL